MSFILYLSSTILGSIGAWFVFQHAHLMGLIDKPTERSSHDRPTPKGGGIGILFVFIMVCILNKIAICFWIPVTGLSLLSLFGDRINLNPGLRLVVQFGVAFLFLTELDISSLTSVKEFHQFLISILIYVSAAVYVVGTANFFNFMDGINGIAGITGIIGFSLLGSYGAVAGRSPELTTLSFAMVFACAGFLPFNIPKARVFMGDVGSILLGFVFACIVVAFTRTFSDFVILVCFMFPFYMDELITMLERIIDGQSLTLPHRRHFYQVLVNEGQIAHWKVSLGYGILQLLVGLFVWSIVQRNLLLGVIGIGMLAIIFFFINMKVKNFITGSDPDN